MVDTGFRARIEGNLSLLTHKGRRKSNEDAIEIREFEVRGKRAILIAIADGMGGHLSGEIASQIAAKGFVDNLERSLKTSLELEDIKVSIYGAYKAVNQEIITRSRKEAASDDMGSTLTAAVIIGNEYLVSNIGDSRAYRISKDDIVQVSQDHSAGAESLREGIINEIEARGNRYANTLTKFLGSEDAFMPDLFPEHGFFKASPGEVLLLCTDGVSGVLDEITIFEHVTEAPDIGQAAQRLISSAHRKGSLDNMSVVLVEPASKNRGQSDKPVWNRAKAGQKKPRPKRQPFLFGFLLAIIEVGLVMLLISAMKARKNSILRPSPAAINENEIGNPPNIVPLLSPEAGQNKQDMPITFSIEQRNATLRWKVIPERNNITDFTILFYSDGQTRELLHSEHTQKKTYEIGVLLWQKLKPHKRVHWQVSYEAGNRIISSEKKELNLQDQ